MAAMQIRREPMRPLVTAADRCAECRGRNSGALIASQKMRSAGAEN
jgi:hypothetical protein